MKTLLLFAAFISVAFSSNAQYSTRAQASQDALVGQRKWVSPPLPMQGGQVVYEETVPVAQSLETDVLFNNALEWYNYNYKTADTRLSVENKAKGKISGTGVIKYNPAAAGVTGEMPIFFDFDLLVQKGQYNYKIYNIRSIDATGTFNYAEMYREDRDTNPQLKPRWNKMYRYEILSDMNTMIEMAIVHLKQNMQMNSGVVTN